MSLSSQNFSGITIRSNGKNFLIQDTSVDPSFEALSFWARERTLQVNGEIRSNNIVSDTITVGTLKYSALDPPPVGTGTVTGPAVSDLDEVPVWDNMVGSSLTTTPVTIAPGSGNISTPGTISAGAGVSSFDMLSFTAIDPLSPPPLGLGNVNGPSSSVTDMIALFDGVDGDTLKESVLLMDTDGGLTFTPGGQSWIVRNGDSNAFGFDAMSAIVAGIQNTAIGHQSMLALTSGSSNTAVGTGSLIANVEGVQNTAIGALALQNSSPAALSGNNTAVGALSLTGISTGTGNIAIGSLAGGNLTLADSDNILIGNDGVSGNTGLIKIGTSGIHINTCLSGSLSLPDKQYETPGTGDTVTIFNFTAIVVIDPAGSIADLEIDMPATPEDGQLVSITITQDITNMLIQNSTASDIVVRFPTIVRAPVSGTWCYSANEDIWFSTEVPCSGDVDGPPGPIFPSDNAFALFSGDSGKLLKASILSTDGSGNIFKTDRFIHELGGAGNFGAGSQALNVVAGGIANTAIGQVALSLNETGSRNTAVGADALMVNELGSDNVAVGSSSLLNNLSGDRNVAIGNNALAQITTGNESTAVGYEALALNTTGFGNTAVGYRGITSNSTGDNNTAVGHDALLSVTVGDNTAVGFQALRANSTGQRNVAVGSSSLTASSGNDNTAIGYNSMVINIGGIQNVAIGSMTLENNMVNMDCTAVGFRALQNSRIDGLTAVGSGSLNTNTTGFGNTAVGYQALNLNDNTDNNTAIGYQALLNNVASDNTSVGNIALAANTMGRNNTAVGNNALTTNTTGDGNTAIGSRSLQINETGNSNTAVGENALETVEVDNNTAIGNSAGTLISTGVGNTILGSNTGVSTETGSGNTVIGRIISGTLGSGNSMSAAINNTIIIGNDGSGAIDGDIRIGNTTDHFNTYLPVPGRLVSGITNLPETSLGPFGGGIVVIPADSSVVTVSLIGPFPLATLTIDFTTIDASATVGDIVRLSFYDVASGIPPASFVTAVTMVGVEPSSALTTMDPDNQGTTWYKSSASWIRIG